MKTAITKPTLHLLRRRKRLLRTIAVMVVVAFATQIVAPAAYAARTATDRPQPHAASDQALLSEALHKVTRKIAALDEHLAAGGDGSQEMADLIALRRDVVALDQKAQARFAGVAAALQRRDLPVAILVRHRAKVTHYRQALATLLADLDAIDRAPNTAVRQARVAEARRHLDGKPFKPTHQPFDPDALPSATLKPDPRNQPRRTKGDFSRAGLFSNPAVHLAALGDFTYANLPGADNPAYLAATTEVKLSPAIAAKAAELNHDPVAIYHWVRNHVEWLPTWGAMQDADLTLGSRRGNAFDIAALLIALLRASGIPARYVHGTIEVPAAKFQNWAGGFTTPEAALHFAGSGGIPIQGVVTGGHVTHARMEHIWVEAAIDYEPSRGAINRDADNWVALDASYKQYEFLEGLDAVAISGIDPAALAQSFIDSGTVNEMESWVTGFEPAILEDAQNQASAALETYIDENLTDPTVGDVIGGNRTVVQEGPVLPSSLPNTIVVEGTQYAEIPTQLQHRVTFLWDKDAVGQWQAPLTLPWAAVNNQKVTLSFKPATAADEEALLALLPEGEITDVSQLPSSIPAYLIQVIPELAVNGVVVKQSAPIGLGEEIPFTFRIEMPGQTVAKQATSPVPAGAYLSVATVGGSVSPTLLQALQTKVTATKAALESGDATLIGALNREDLLGDIFYAGTLAYFAQYTALAHITALASHGHHSLMPSVGTYGYVPKVDYLFGFPSAIEPGGVAMDLDAVNGVSDSSDGDAARRRDLVFQTGILSSALEHAVPEQMFVTPDNPGEAISAVKALAKANLAGQRIYHITAANQTTTLPNIHHDPDVLSEIQAALNAGKEVITHTDTISVPGWSGAGYIIFDAETGDGAFKISGGANGSKLPLAFLTGVAQGAAAAAMIIALFAALPQGALAVMALSIVFLFVFVPILVAEAIYAREVFSSDQERACLYVGVSFGVFVAGVIAAVPSGAAKAIEKLFIFIAAALLGDQFESITKCLT